MVVQITIIKKRLDDIAGPSAVFLKKKLDYEEKRKKHNE